MRGFFLFLFSRRSYIESFLYLYYFIIFMINPGMVIGFILLVDIILMIILSKQKKKYGDKLASYKKDHPKSGFWKALPYIIAAAFLVLSAPFLGNDLKKLWIVPLFVGAITLITVIIIVALVDVNKAKKS
jgi:hypothetical protein